MVALEASSVSHVPICSMETRCWVNPADLVIVDQWRLDVTASPENANAVSIQLDPVALSASLVVMEIPA